MKKSQATKNREMRKRIQDSTPPKLRTAEDMQRIAGVVSDALGVFGAMVAGIGAFSNAVRSAQQQGRVVHSVKEADPEIVDGQAEVISSQIKKI